MGDNSLFGMGFPGPQVTAQEIDSLPSRLAQAKGVQQAAVQKAQAKIDSLLEPARQAADNAVGALLEPVEQILTVAGHSAAQAVQTGQLATVRALQQPLVQALKYGYVNQGTPVLSPTGKKTRSRRKAAVGVDLPPPPPPSPPPGPVPTSYTIWFNCVTKDVAAVPNFTPDGSWGGWRPPFPWSGGYGFTAGESQLLPYLKQWGEGMFEKSCPNYIPPG